MTISQLLIVASIMLLSHELKPSVRLAIGAALGLWGAVFVAVSILY